MATIGDLANHTLQRLQEDPNAPIFWTEQEVLDAVVEAMNEAALLSGVVQVAQSAPITLPTNTNIVNMPTNAVCLLRVLGPNMIRKTEMFTLDQMNRYWENDTGPQITAWFPFGVNQFGIYPKLTAQQQVQVSYLAYPVTVAPPYAGTETVPFQEEFLDALEQYAAHVLRIKEGGNDFAISQMQYTQYLDTMKRLSLFQTRHDSIVFTRSVGAPVRVQKIEVR